MADKGGIQLLSETRRKLDLSTPGENKIMTIGLIVLVVVFIIYGGLYWYRGHLTNNLTNLDATLTSLEEQRNKKTEQSLSIFQKQTQLISQMLRSHLYWTEGFAKIESLLQNQIQFETFTASSTEGVLNFKALAANYTVIAKQIAAFSSSDAVEDVTLNNVNTLTNGKLQFNMNIKFKPESFLAKKK